MNTTNVKRYLLIIVNILYAYFIASTQSGLVLQADIFLTQGDKIKATEYYTKAAYDEMQKSNNLIAVQLFEKSMHLNEELGNQKAVAAICQSIGALYSSLRDVNKALEYLQKAAVICKKNKDNIGLSEVNYNIGCTYQNANKHIDAIEYLELAKAVFQESKNFYLLKKCYLALYSSYDALNNSSKSTEYFSLYSALDTRLKNEEINKIKVGAEEQVKSANILKSETEKQLNSTQQVLKETVDTLQKTKQLTEEQKLAIALNEAKIRETQTQLDIEQLQRSRYAIAFIAVVFVLILIILFGLRIRKAKLLIQKQKKIVELQNQNIKSSIDYAKMIQNIMLPTKEQIASSFKNFIIYLPKDIVSGDFYWHSRKVNDYGEVFDYIALADCTGHGVPGAFMSMLGNRLLTEIINDNAFLEPNEILEHLDIGIKETLRQDVTNNRDGMEIGLCVFKRISDSKVILQYASAKRPLYIISKNKAEIIVVEPTRRAIGGKNNAKKMMPFDVKKIELQKGDCLYIVSDGLCDQNNINRVKYGSQRLRLMLMENVLLPIEEQENIIRADLQLFMAGEEQRDDISMIGLQM